MARQEAELPRVQGRHQAAGRLQGECQHQGCVVMVLMLCCPGAGRVHGQAVRAVRVRGRSACQAERQGEPNCQLCHWKYIVYGCFPFSQDERLKLRQEEEAAAAARLQDRRARAERRNEFLIGDGEEEEGDNLEMVDIVLNRYV